jgi:hypothetical protein
MRREVTTPNAFDLDTLIERAKAREAATRSNESAQASLIKLLASAPGGCLPVSECLRRGTHKETIALLVSEESTSTDKRKRARVKLSIIRLNDGTEVATLHLTALGWTVSGRPSQKEHYPTAEGIAHAMAPSAIASWFEKKEPTLSALGISVTVAWGAVTRSFSEDVVARSWARLKVGSDATGSVGALTGGLFPDLVILERFRDPQTFKQAWPDRQATDDNLAESVVACEVQHSNIATTIFRSRVERWDAALETLNAAAACLWIVKGPRVADSLTALGVGSGRRPSQYLVPSWMLGLDGDPTLEASEPKWWTLRIT